MFTLEQMAALSAPLDRKHVKERTQAGRNLSYLEGWHCIAEANRIFGFDGWTRQTIEIRAVAERERQIGRPPNTKDGWGVSYIAKVRVTVGEIVREGVGSGHGIDVDLGLAHESAIKEAETDAMKRALMTFGNPFGLALYDKQQTQVADEPSHADRYLSEETAFVGHCESLTDLQVHWKAEKQARMDILSETQRSQLAKVVTARVETLKANVSKEAA